MTTTIPFPSSQVPLIQIVPGSVGDGCALIQQNLMNLSAAVGRDIVFTFPGSYSTGTNLTPLIIVPLGGYIASISAVAKTVTTPTTFQVMLNGEITIQTSPIQITTNNAVVTQTTFATSTFSPNDYFSINIIAGSGSDATVDLLVIYT